MSYISTQEKYSHLKRLMELAQSDESFNMAELSFVVWLAKKLDISDKELQRISQEQINHAAPLMETDRLNFFHDCLKLIFIDGEVNEDEIDHCTDIGASIQLDRSRLEKVLKTVEQQAPNMMTSEELKKLYYEF